MMRRFVERRDRRCQLYGQPLDLLTVGSGSGCADHPINLDRLKPSSKRHEVTALPHEPRGRSRASPHAAECKCYPAPRDGRFDARQAQPPR